MNKNIFFHYKVRFSEPTIDPTIPELPPYPQDMRTLNIELRRRSLAMLDAALNIPPPQNTRIRSLQEAIDLEEWYQKFFNDITN